MSPMAMPVTANDHSPPRLLVAGGLLVASLLAWSWLSTRVYSGIAHDGVYYSMLALAHAQPAALGHDIFVSHGSQGSWTLFPALFAVAIRHLGLEPAALAITLVSNALALLAAWLLAGRLASGVQRLVAVLLLLWIPGFYGAERVFGYLEPFPTPRTLAEAAVMSAVALTLRPSPSRKATLGAIGCLAAALLIHPLIAMPGLLLCLLLARPMPLAGAAPTAALLALAAATPPLLAASGLLAAMDGDWLRIVRGIAPYLFLSEWSLLDWQRLAVPTCSLSMGWAVLPQGSTLQRLAGAALTLVGLALAVAWVGSEITPATLVIQGQAWRWLWLSKAVAVLALAPTLVAAWRLGGMARAGAALLLGGWLGSEDALGMPAALLGMLMVVLARGQGAPWGRRVVTAWLVAAALLVPLLQVCSLLDEAAFAGLAIAFAWLAARRALAAQVIACLATALLLGREAAAHLRTPLPQAADLSEARIASFEDWRRRIPASSVVLHPGDAQALWMMLRRASYMGPDQTIGATFSRAAALEMERRAHEIEALLPMESTLLRMGSREPPATLTVSLRDQLCALPGVDFVVGTQPLPGPRLMHPSLFPEPNLYLYDCRAPLPAGAPHS